MICSKCCSEVQQLKDGICPDCELEGAGVAPAAPPLSLPAPSGLTKAAEKPDPRPPVAMTEGGVQLRSLDDLARFASMVVKSGLAPKGMDKPEAVALAVQAGMELGFSPLRALSVVTVINGRTGLMGTAVLAKIRESGRLKPGTQVLTGLNGAGEDRYGWVKTWRDGDPGPVERQFSVKDAKAMGLWGKPGPWTNCPGDMLIWRAVARTNKLDWSDVTLGLEVAEALRDHEEPAPRILEAPGPDPLTISA